MRGSILDDLARRDFTMNAMAISEDGDLIDPHAGAIDVKFGIVRCVGSPEKRFSEDGLRILRAIRFCVTLDFTMAMEVEKFIKQPEAADLLHGVSEDRIRQELHKGFAANSVDMMEILCQFPYITRKLFDNDLWLLPTNRKVK